MGYIEQTLTPGEQVLHRTRLHWIVLLWPFVFAIVFAAAAVACLIGWYSSRNDPNATLGRTALLALVVAEVLVAAIALVAGLVRRAGIEMAVTNRRLIVKTGVVRRHTIEMMLSKIESISVSQGVLGRIANYGDVLVRGSGGTAEHFARIADPLRLRLKAQEQIERSHGMGGPAPAATIAAAPNPAEYAPPGAFLRPVRDLAAARGRVLPALRRAAHALSAAALPYFRNSTTTPAEATRAPATNRQVSGSRWKRDAIRIVNTGWNAVIDAAMPAWMNWSAASERVTPRNGPNSDPATMNRAAVRSRRAATVVRISRRMIVITSRPTNAATTRITVADSASMPVRSASFEITYPAAWPSAPSTPARVPRATEPWIGSNCWLRRSHSTQLTPPSVIAIPSAVSGPGTSCSTGHAISAVKIGASDDSIAARPGPRITSERKVQVSPNTNPIHPDSVSSPT